MIETATPAPADTQARIDQQAQVFSRTMIALGASIADDLERAATAAGRVLREHTERSAQRWRVRSLMPTLTLREVLVHGYVPHKEA